MNFKIYHRQSFIKNFGSNSVLRNHFNGEFDPGSG